MSTSTRQRGARPARPFVTARRNSDGLTVAVLPTGYEVPLIDLSIQEIRKVAFATFGPNTGFYILGATKQECLNRIVQWIDDPNTTTTTTTATEVSEETFDDDDDEVITVRVKRDRSVDEAKVREIVNAEIEARVAVPKVVKVGDRPEVKIDGKTHKDFDALLRKVSARRNLFLTGTAGVGKTFIVEQIAQALGISCTTVTADPLPQRFEILGGRSVATGDVIDGAVRKPYENGGIFLIDEFDTGHASLGTALNKLLANDTFDFDSPEGGKVTVRKHPDFVVLATGNTYGQGGSLRYVGTNRINGAGLDRFTFFHVDVDEDLTEHICTSVNPDASAKVIPVWRTARRNVETYNLDYLVTPRCAIDATHFVTAGDSLREALNGRLFGRGLPADQEAKLLDGIRL